MHDYISYSFARLLAIRKDEHDRCRAVNIDEVEGIERLSGGDRVCIN